MSKLARGFKCADCLTNTSRIGEYFMVTKEIWSLAWSGWRRPRDGVRRGRQSMLCIRCLERRIGRTLTHADFTDAPVNDPGWSDKSERLLDRLSRSAPGRPRKRNNVTQVHRYET